ncbi:MULTISPECIES: alpha/beta hydrolase [Paenibacillus]|uniref:alpha/beta hydrolase n=1 Tax=Paenibacillus TaxID=44249 RepID=UPI0022B88523|nr:alpha/beta hydrolase [Paenibacillus caseinilyticus]MCZ8524107.1 lysophospholipase [Paenibacillus caseinilyticus]
MLSEEWTYRDQGGEDIHTYVWLPDQEAEIRGIVQIAHGMAETALRYKRFAHALTEAGYAVYANDHRGHGRTAGNPQRLGIVGRDGFRLMCGGMAQLTDLIRERHPHLPVYLFGHSMGSFLTQRYMYTYPDKADGIILSGSNGPQGRALQLGIWLAKQVVSRKGEGHRSMLLLHLTLGGYNRAFRPNRTLFDWLSRDEQEVDKYAADPDCGAVFSAQFWEEFFRCLAEIHRKENMERIPKSLPVLLFSGDRDPVGMMGKGVRRLAALYAGLGMKRVTLKLYPGGRHEMLNEINRDEVTRDVLDWLNGMLTTKA